MKKLLIPIVALLAFSTLSTSVSAIMPDYYMASFYSEAEGCCSVYASEHTCGKGSAHIRGLAIVKWDEGCQHYWAKRSLDSNTRLWTRRTHVTVSWNNKKLTVWMWPNILYDGVFNNIINTFEMRNMSYFGYYIGEIGLKFISGTAVMYGVFDSPIPILEVKLFLTTPDPWLTFVWSTDVYDGCPPARQVIRRVTVWGPIPWLPSA